MAQDGYDEDEAYRLSGYGVDRVDVQPLCAYDNIQIEISECILNVSSEIYKPTLVLCKLLLLLLLAEWKIFNLLFCRGKSDKKFKNSIYLYKKYI